MPLETRRTVLDPQSTVSPCTQLKKFYFHAKNWTQSTVLTYIEYRAVSSVFQTINPPPPLHPANVSSPCTKGGGGRKTPDIGLASCSIIPLRNWMRKHASTSCPVCRVLFMLLRESLNFVVFSAVPRFS